MNRLFAVYEEFIDCRSLVALFSNESDAEQCKAHLCSIVTSRYEEYQKYYIEEAFLYTSFDNYIDFKN